MTPQHRRWEWQYERMDEEMWCRSIARMFLDTRKREGGPDFEELGSREIVK